MPISKSAADKATLASAGDVPEHMSQPQRKTSVEDDSSSSSSSSNLSNEKRPSIEQANRLKSPRTPRFAEATSVVSPIEPSSRGPFAVDPATSTMTGSESNGTAAPDVSDVGFGYVADHRASRHATYPEIPQDAALRSNPPNSPLKSALKSPGTPGTKNNPLSPTFREEQILEIREKETEEENAKDIKVKTRVRIAKFFLRGVNFSCSLIIVALVAQTFIIFNATRSLASRNSMNAWAPDTDPWPQILVLVIASITLLLSVCVIYGYWRGGHRRAEKVNTYYNIFAVFMFTVTLVIWVVVAAVFQNSKSDSNGHDIWAWACKDNDRARIFGEDVDFELVCRMQDWVLICVIIEIIVDVITIAIYSVVFYRFYSKRKLRKTMDARDKARSDLYLAHLRTQTAPNTPGFPRSPMSSASPPMKQDPYSAAENGDSPSTQYAIPQSPATVLTTSKRPFQLQPVPARNQGQGQGNHSTSGSATNSVIEPMSPGFAQRVNEHVGAAPGERTYESVPIPGAYATPMASPSFAPQQQQEQQQNLQRNGSLNFGIAVSTDSTEETRSSSRH